jgi:hypothetical protein
MLGLGKKMIPMTYFYESRPFLASPDAVTLLKPSAALHANPKPTGGAKSFEKTSALTACNVLSCDQCFVGVARRELGSWQGWLFELDLLRNQLFSVDSIARNGTAKLDAGHFQRELNIPNIFPCSCGQPTYIFGKTVPCFSRSLGNDRQLLTRVSWLMGRSIPRLSV